MLTEFCENSEVVSSDFSMMKNNDALSSSGLPKKKINLLFKIRVF